VLPVRLGHQPILISAAPMMISPSGMIIAIRLIALLNSMCERGVFNR
jgi:hypothetical protein